MCSLEKIRVKKGISRLGLAKKSGISRQTIIEIENGTRTNLQTDTIRKLAEALNCDISELFS